MYDRVRLGLAGIATLACMVSACAPEESASLAPYDVLISGGTVIDGNLNSRVD